MRLVGYIRVSSESQEDNTSLKEQQEKIENYCKAFGYELVAIFREVGSGSKMTTRPEFGKAMDLLKEDQADGIIATKLDRIARNCKDVLTMVDDVLQPLGKALILLDLNVDTTNPVGKMILTVMAAVAELERSQINERTQGGRKAKAKDGGYAYGGPAYGQKAENKELSKDESELETVQIICDLKKQGLSLRAIAKYLNDKGIKSKQGKDFIHTSVNSIIKRYYKE